jgi:hypothetical protein
VDKLSEREITCLMMRKLSRDKLVSLITRWFMDVDIMGIPDNLDYKIERLVETSPEAD